MTDRMAALERVAEAVRLWRDHNSISRLSDLWEALHALDALPAEPVGEPGSVPANLWKLPDNKRLALARALVADMPGVVVAQVPDAWLVPAEKNTPYNKGRRRGWNDFRTELISAGSATHQPKEDGA